MVWSRTPHKDTPEKLKAHLSKCGDQDCACRRVAFNYARWQPKLPIITPECEQRALAHSQPASEKAAALKGESWFCFGIEAGAFVGYCAVCRNIDKAGNQFSKVSQCKPFLLSRHAQCSKHVEAVCRLLGVDSTSEFVV